MLATLIIDTEMLRDGGSLSISFQDIKLSQFVLIFPISRTPNVEFEKPVLVNVSLDIELSIGWDDSLCYLNQLVTVCKTNDQKSFIYNMMSVAKKFT
ncbi:hypothetical protein [Pseudoalteromonas luteoviolacea]|uniref:hypothetical protein n=1 Tax=Pseudoalteromonas luteoviolacea TaxID=43657 RepID=UPI00114DE822|nr:hypothetical protein [Pseudoalteromonas luteoviolacea]TQF70117.1 hypothetical protein FLM44_03215 [Pseudoalteromonas luteoviolacea]